MNVCISPLLPSFSELKGGGGGIKVGSQTAELWDDKNNRQMRNFAVTRMMNPSDPELPY